MLDVSQKARDRQGQQGSNAERRISETVGGVPSGDGRPAIPFGLKCEHKDFASCVATMQGKVDDPEAFCGALMRDTEDK